MRYVITVFMPNLQTLYSNWADLLAPLLNTEHQLLMFCDASNSLESFASYAKTYQNVSLHPYAPGQEYMARRSGLEAFFISVSADWRADEGGSRIPPGFKVMDLHFAHYFCIEDTEAKPVAEELYPSYRVTLPLKHWVDNLNCYFSIGPGVQAYWADTISALLVPDAKIEESEAPRLIFSRLWPDLFRQCRRHDLIRAICLPSGFKRCITLSQARTVLEASEKENHATPTDEKGDATINPVLNESFPYYMNAFQAWQWNYREQFLGGWQKENDWFSVLGVNAEISYEALRDRIDLTRAYFSIGVFDELFFDTFSTEKVWAEGEILQKLEALRNEPEQILLYARDFFNSESRFNFYLKLLYPSGQFLLNLARKPQRQFYKSLMAWMESEDFTGTEEQLIEKRQEIQSVLQAALPKRHVLFSPSRDACREFCSSDSPAELGPESPYFREVDEIEGGTCIDENFVLPPAAAL